MGYDGTQIEYVTVMTTTSIRNVELNWLIRLIRGMFDEYSVDLLT